jgi:phosphoribosyl 1,2-cyclic phosphodiesterase
MRLAVLGSGSGGNSLIIESGGRRLLVDAGFSCRQIERRLALLGEEASAVDALLLTHEHQDHCRGVDVLLQRHRLPLYATEGTVQGLSWRSPERAEAAELRTVRSGEPFEVPARGCGEIAFRVEAFSLPHDAREPVGFVIEDGGGRRVGLVADLGTRTQLAWGRLRDLDCLVIETNHDLGMLRSGPYPWHLKQRVASRHGHLSNRDAASGLDDLVCDRLRSVVLYHLSRTNNLPALAARTVEEKLAAVGSAAETFLTWQDEPTPWIEIPDTVGPGRFEARPEAHQLEIW